jgi:hypothetical protein
MIAIRHLQVLALAIRQSVTSHPEVSPSQFCYPLECQLELFHEHVFALSRTKHEGAILNRHRTPSRRLPTTPGQADLPIARLRLDGNPSPPKPYPAAEGFQNGFSDTSRSHTHRLHCRRSL